MSQSKEDELMHALTDLSSERQELRASAGSLSVSILCILA
jgi:hypothetical protein